MNANIARAPANTWRTRDEKVTNDFSYVMKSYVFTRDAKYCDIALRLRALFVLEIKYRLNFFVLMVKVINLTVHCHQCFAVNQFYS